MLKTINSDGSLKISLIGSAVPAGAVYNDGLTYAPDGSLYVKLTQGALSGQVYNGGLACTPDGALYVANSTPAASATFRRGLLCRADGAVHVSDATVATVRHDGGVPKDNAGRLFVGIPLAGLALATDAATGVTSSGGFASAWADLSGNARNLLQVTGANQPIHLPFSGTQYGWLPGVAGNYFSMPDSVAASVTGDIDLRWYGPLDDWTPAAESALLLKGNAYPDVPFSIHIRTDGTIGSYFKYSDDTVESTNSVTPTPFANGASGWVRMTRVVSTGLVTFYTSSDGDTWTPLGSTSVLSAGKSLKDNVSAVLVGSYSGGAGGLAAGKCYRAQIYNGIDGTLVVDFDPSRWTSGTTFTASTGETWTINSTGSKPAQIVDRASLLFDGAAHYMKTAPFTLNQPETVYLVAKRISWAVSDGIFDGDTQLKMLLNSDPTTPSVALYAGTANAPESTGWAVGATAVVASVFNGASSSIQVNAGSVTTGNPGTNNAGGFTLGMRSGVAGTEANIQAYEALIYNVAHDAATRANIIRALMSKHGVA